MTGGNKNVSRRFCGQYQSEMTDSRMLPLTDFFLSDLCYPRKSAAQSFIGACLVRDHKRIVAESLVQLSFLNTVLRKKCTLSHFESLRKTDRH